MRLEPVPVAYVHTVWPEAARLLEATFRIECSEFTMEQLHAMLAIGAWQMLVVTDSTKLHAVVIADTYNRPNDRVMFIKAVGGHKLVSNEIMVQLTQYARSVGATSIETACRESVQRLLSQVGFKEKYRVIGVEL